MASDKEKRTARLPSVRVSHELLEKVKRDSLAVGKSVSDYIRDLLSQGGNRPSQGGKQPDTPATPPADETAGDQSWREIL